MLQSPTLQVAKTVEQVDAIRDVWLAMQSNPAADLDFYLTLLKTRPEILRPHVITLRDNGKIVSMLVGRIEKARPTVGLGYAKLPLPSVRCLTVVGAGLFGDQSGESISALVSSVEKSLKANEADVAWFHQLDADSSLCEAVQSIGGGARRDSFPAINDHWKVRLPETYEQFLRGRTSATRNDINRNTKRLQASLGEHISVRRFKDMQEIDLLMADTEVVAAKTYHRGINAGFMHDEETRRRMSLYASTGKLRAHLLYVDGKPIAFWNGFLYGRTFYTWTTGYDPEYRSTRPGLFLLQQVFADLCEERVADHVDFGSGDAQYKRDWCDENQKEISFYLFGPSFKGILLNMLRTPMLAGAQAARWALKRTNLLEKTKKLWRSRLSQRRQLEKQSGAKEVHPESVGSPEPTVSLDHKA